MSRYDVKDASESPTRLPLRQHAHTGENTSFDIPALLTTGEDTSSEIPAIYYQFHQGHGHRNRDEICQVDGPHAPRRRSSSAPPVLRAERLDASVPRDVDVLQHDHIAVLRK